MPCISREELYQFLIKNQLLSDLKNGPTAVILSVSGESCRVSLKLDQGLVIAESDSFAYTYEYPDHLKGDCAP